MNIIKIRYSLLDDPNHTYEIFIYKDTTIGELLFIINNKNKIIQHKNKQSDVFKPLTMDNYTTIFIEKSIIKPDEKVFNYWKSNPQIIFIALPEESESPSSAYLQSINETINSKAEESKFDFTKKFRFMFTGCDKEMLLNGIEVELNMKMNPKECCEQLFHYIEDKIDIKNKEMIVYLAGGIQFKSGTLGDFYMSETFKIRNVIYGVLIRKIPDEYLNLHFISFLNISDPNQRLLVSPLCDSTDRGVSDMACFYQFITMDEYIFNIFHLAISSIIIFPPFIISLYNIIDRTKRRKSTNIGVEIATIFSTLYTFFKSILLPFSISNENVFEYGLRLCNLVLNTECPQNTDSIAEYNIKLDKEPINFLFKTQLSSLVFLWKGDIGEKFVQNDFNPYKKEIDCAYDFFNTFTPKILYFCRNYRLNIIKGSHYNYLQGKNPYCLSFIRNKNYSKISGTKYIYDPMKGSIEQVNIHTFDKSNESTDITNIIHPNKVKQIVLINIDESQTMSKFFEEDDNDFFLIYNQYLTILTDKFFANDIACFHGLVSFNNEIKMKCPFTLFSDEFEKQSLENFEPKSKPKLWDSLSFSCKEIYKFRKDIEGNEIYPNAISRIIILSSGNDFKSKVIFENLVKELIKNKIIIDSIIINPSQDKKFNMLSAISHITGGLSFYAKNYEEIIPILENGSFINYAEREILNEPLLSNDRTTIPYRIKPNQITKQFMNQIIEKEKFDTIIPNKIIKQAMLNAPVITPQNYINKNKDKQIFNSRFRRIMIELQEVNKFLNSDINDHIKVYLYKSNIDIWKVFIYGYEGSLYEKKKVLFARFFS